MKPDDTIDQTPVLDIPQLERQPFDFQAHDWKQEGYYVLCRTCPGITTHAFAIRPGQMLVGEKGSWRIEKEGGRMKH